MADYAKFSLKDYDGEPSSTTISVAEVTAANIDAHVTALGTLRTTAEAIMLQGWFGVNLTDEIYTSNPAISDPYSQREHKWVVIVQDSLGNVYKANEIPCADLSILENNSKYIYKGGSPAVTTAAAAVQAFVDAFEAIARDKAGGVLTVVDIFQAGRNI